MITVDLGDYRVVEVSIRGVVIQIARNVHITIEPAHIKEHIDVKEGDTLTLYTKFRTKAIS